MSNMYLFLMDVKRRFEFTEKNVRNACINENVMLL